MLREISEHLKDVDRRLERVEARLPPPSPYLAAATSALTKLVRSVEFDTPESGSSSEQPIRRGRSVPPPPPI